MSTILNIISAILEKLTLLLTIFINVAINKWNTLYNNIVFIFKLNFITIAEYQE